MPLNNNALNGTRNNIAYVGVNAPTPSNTLQVARAPGVQDKKNVYQGDFWIDTTTKNMYVYLGNNSSGEAVWNLITSVGGDITTLSDTAGTLVAPTAAGNVQLEAGTGITVTSDPGNNKLVIAQATTTIATGTTTDATPLVITSLAIPVNTGYAFRALVHGVDDAFTKAASFAIMRGVRRGAGAAVLIGALNQQICSDAPIGVTCDVSLNVNTIEVTVTGELATTYNWTINVDWVEVTL